MLCSILQYTQFLFFCSLIWVVIVLWNLIPQTLFWHQNPIVSRILIWNNWNKSFSCCTIVRICTMDLFLIHLILQKRYPSVYTAPMKYLHNEINEILEPCIISHTTFWATTTNPKTNLYTYLPYTLNSENADRFNPLRRPPQYNPYHAIIQSTDSQNSCKRATVFMQKGDRIHTKGRP